MGTIDQLLQARWRLGALQRRHAGGGGEEAALLRDLDAYLRDVDAIDMVRAGDGARVAHASLRADGLSLLRQVNQDLLLDLQGMSPETLALSCRVLAHHGLGTRRQRPRP